MPDQLNTSPAAPDAPPEVRLQSLIENISAYIEFYHGGSVNLVDFDGSVAKVKLGGACTGCELSEMTLRGWVAGTVSQFFPDVTVVAAAEE